MKIPPIPANESERLRALAEYQIVDTPPERSFDALTTLAAHILEMPIALVSIIDADRQWFKSRYGLEAPETSRDISFCGHAVAADAPLIVPDALADDRFADNPLVVGEPRIRFYAGIPLRTPEGYMLGTLCAIDREPHEITATQHEMLSLLAGQVVAQLELRRQNRLLDAQRQVNERHQQFFKLTLDLLCTADETLHFRELNPAWEDTLGWTLDELRSRPFTEFVHPDDLERTFAEAGRLLTDSSTTVNFENRYRHKDGRWVPLAWTAATFGATLFATARDMSAYREKERSLVDSEARLRAIIDTAVDAILTIDERGTIERANPAVTNLFGFEPDELVGRNVKLLMPSPDHERHDGYLEAYLRTGRRKVIGIGREVTALRKDGTTFAAELSVSELLVSGERRFTGMIRDISERKLVAQLQSEFVSTVSHELRTPLTAIRGSLGLIAGGAAGEIPERARALIAMAHRNSERLARLVDDILDIEKIEAGRLEFQLARLDPVELTRQTMAANDAVATQHHVQLVLESDEHVPSVLGDSDRLTQVLTNLLSNAIKFSPASAEVRVTVTRHQDQVRVAVRDRGPGVPKEFAGRIFGRFQQAEATDNRSRGGTGLGLAIAKSIVERLGGAIGFESTPGEGSVFFFDLPALDEGVEPSAGEPLRPRVLICEDDHDLGQLLRFVLTEAGFEPTVAWNAAEAKRLLAAGSFDAMTLDLMLPDQDGIDLLRDLRASPATARLPVVVVSARADEGRSEIEGAGLAVIDWLEKPVDPARLLAALRSGLRPEGEELVILHVEDDSDARRILTELMAADGRIVPALSLREAQQLLGAQRFDLVVLDLGLPDGSGVALLVDIAALGALAPPVVILSAREMSRELASRVNAVLIKGQSSNESIAATLRRLLSAPRRRTGLGAPDSESAT